MDIVFVPVFVTAILPPSVGISGEAILFMAAAPCGPLGIVIALRRKRSE
jgi:hypothetical protein